MWDPNNAVFNAPPEFWKDADPSTAPPVYDGIDVVAHPMDVDEVNDDPMVATSRQHYPAVKNTQIAMWLFSKTPTVSKMLSGMPQGTTMSIIDDATTSGYDEHAVAIPKDVWNNPIILVPASGLRNVTLADTPGYIVTSVRIYPPAGGASPTLAPGDLAPNARPFFASAGPDGDFAKGDDNIYSFESQ
jgi:hypothetical protein